MTLSEYFALAHGNQAALVSAVGAHQPTVHQWAIGARPIPVEHGAAIERATGGQVTRQELFPDIWARIWPELAAPASDRPGKSSHTPAIDHAAELRGAIAQTRLVFEGHRDAQDALEYLEQVLAGGQGAEVPARACEPAASHAICNLAIKVDTTDLERATALANQFNDMLQGWAPALAKLSDRITATMAAAAEHAAEALAAESAQLAVQAEKAAASVAACARVDPVAVLSREVFSLSNKLQQPADLTVQMLLLAELRGMRAEQASDRFARGAAVLS